MSIVSGDETSQVLPKIAIVGRPNVGKSTLFNRLVGKKLALVDDQPGVTRDRRYGLGRIGNLLFHLMDTAGLELHSAHPLGERMQEQTAQAISEADLLFFVVDARTDLTAADHDLTQMIRRSGKPFMLLANKAESSAALGSFYRTFELGLGEPILLSAEHNEGFSFLQEALQDLFEDPAFTSDLKGRQPASGDTSPHAPMKVAIVGRPNAGKSTLLNALLGEERFLTGPEAGITRDALCAHIVWHSPKGTQNLALWDTAGLRKYARVTEKLERLAWNDARRAINFAEIVVLLLDILRPVEKQDLMIADLILKEGRGLVVGVNKIDLVEKTDKLFQNLSQDIEGGLPNVRHPCIIPLSGGQKIGLNGLVEALQTTYASWNQRISTGRLNKWLAENLEKMPPPLEKGRRIKIRYVTQVKARPPHFMIFGNQLDDLPDSYERFLLNSLKETFGFQGVPLRLSRRNSKNPFAP